ncbi:hydrogenase assembly chaperone HypC/HupF [Luminiphilus syltensis NOR5-1B]|uniref:Hydrogenase assembly chaperone HypC/HupF n=1 Tax=Luminiphilus syltensis NOR5-1B TaxID=565045 RepID=B8KXU7_9GAMM|nr:HypC/HybG/HupF family hydrogenase formation chaperone [Luminiphilus syltensis]EED35204.1 hydrogenase assembly chaperone HypC/HupF [Luminiphilus syltensis NOR5-1B]
MCLAIPGCILSTTGDDFSRSARVDFGGVIREVNLAFTPEAHIGDYILVHVGIAIATIDEEEAARVLAALASLNELAAESS